MKTPLIICSDWVKEPHIQLLHSLFRNVMKCIPLYGLSVLSSPQCELTLYFKLDHVKQLDALNALNW